MRYLMKLRVLEKLGQTHKINDTADALGLRQPTVTFHMQSLEKEAGTKLFEQKHGYVGLTDAGQAFLHYAREIIGLADEAQRTMGELNHLKRGKLVVGASYVPATYVLPPVLRHFLREYPQMRVQVHVHPFRSLLEMLARRELDFGLVYSAGEPLAEFTYRPVGVDELVAVCSPKCALAGKRAVTPALLSRCPLVQHGQDSSTRKFVEEWMKKEGVTSRVRLEVNSIESIKRILLRTDAYSVLSRLAVRDEVEAGTLRTQPLPGGPLRREMDLIYPHDRFLTPAAKKFIEFVIKRQPQCLCQ